MTMVRTTLISLCLATFVGGCSSSEPPTEPGASSGGSSGAGGTRSGGKPGGTASGGSGSGSGGATSGGAPGSSGGAGGGGGTGGTTSDPDAAVGSGGAGGGTSTDGPPAGETGGPVGACPPAGAAGQPRRAFPQHVGYPGCPTCIHPTVPQAMMDADVTAFYNAYKKVFKTLTVGDLKGEWYVSAGSAGAIIGWPAGVSSVSQSEGHGYGMMILALMAGHDPMARTMFDSMNRVRKALPSGYDPRLMSWVIPNNGSKALKPQAPATDGDFDMAYALLLAHDQWGDEANSHYLADAQVIITALEEKIITKGMGEFYPRLNIGDPAHFNSGAPESKPDMTRPSDFIVDHMRAFGAASGKSIWLDVENGSLAILKTVRNPTTGLVPDFVAGNPPIPSKTGTADEDVCYACYDYNSCRVPWRQAVAIAHYGVAGSKDVADKMVAWARATYKDTPTSMGSSYTLEGMAKGGEDNAFTSPMVAASIVNPANRPGSTRAGPT
jgi:endo-1,4-beta-D-glucanase Y